MQAVAKSRGRPKAERGGREAGGGRADMDEGCPCLVGVWCGQVIFFFFHREEEEVRERHGGHGWSVATVLHCSTRSVVIRQSTQVKRFGRARVGVEIQPATHLPHNVAVSAIVAKQQQQQQTDAQQLPALILSPHSSFHAEQKSHNTPASIHLPVFRSKQHVQIRTHSHFFHIKLLRHQ
ncbi:hypothetical protein IWZ01DRAFT_507483 [Phyllosticta capitalensis]